MMTKDVAQLHRRDRLIHERVHDPYKLRAKVPEPTVCPECGAVYREGRWQWLEAHPEGAHRERCQACQRIKDDCAAGLVTLSGSFVGAHLGDMVGLIRHQEALEACIALSIAFVATEIVHGRNGQPGITARRPWIVAFAFGPLHGFGFASALHEIGLPQRDVPLVLLFFNVGVEVGQLIFIASVLTVIALARSITIALPAWAWRVPPYAIGAVASFWLIQRLAGLTA